LEILHIFSFTVKLPYFLGIIAYIFQYYTQKRKKTLPLIIFTRTRARVKNSAQKTRFGRNFNFL